MLYLLVSVAYYKQLKAVDQELSDNLDRELSGIEELYGYTKLYSKEGNFLYAFGQEYALDPRRVLEFVFRVHEILESRREQLFGFNLIISKAAETTAEAMAKRLRTASLGLEEEEEVWIDPDCQSLFADSIRTEKSRNFLKVTEKDPSRLPGRKRSQQLWKQSTLARQVVRTINTQAKARRKKRGVFIHGPVLGERKILLDAVQDLLLQDFAVPRAPRLHTLFKRRSAFHPFLNSLDPFFLRVVPQYLTAWERKVWGDLKRLLWSMKPAAGRAEGVFFHWPKGVPNSLRRAGEPALEEERSSEFSDFACPDYLYQDFYAVFQLYLNAYFRMMEENFLPAVLLCEDIDSYHAQSLTMLFDLLKDFYQNSTFIPVFTSASPDLPGRLRDRGVEVITMHPLSSSEMMRLARRLYRGCELSKDTVRKLRSYSRGKLLSYYHCLKFLEEKDYLVKEKNRYLWHEPKPLEALLPARCISVSWSIVTGLSAQLKRLLFIVYIQSGLLDIWGLIDFLEDQGMSREDAFTLLRDLEARGLVHLGNYAVALYPPFGKKLRKIIAREEPELERAFIDYLIECWRRGSYPHLVLLFFMLKKAKRSVEAIEVLTQLLKQKLDELDFKGVKNFLDSKHFRFGADLEAEEQKKLQRLLMAVRLRQALLQGGLKEAEEIYLKAMEAGDDFEVDPTKGHLFLQVSRYLLARGETGTALQWVKKAVIQYQNSSSTGGEREATIGLGAILLAEGKFDEALEYFSMSDSADQATKDLADIVTHGLRGVTLFIQGNLSRAETETEAGLALSRTLERREWELFLQFLKARISFELGFYDEAVLGVQYGLAIERLYRNPSARKVLYLWLGRTFAYSGSVQTALRVLGEQEDSWEKLYFTAECHFFRREYAKALEACDRAISLGQSFRGNDFPGQRIGWLNGFRDIEGRCFELLRDNALIQRLTQSFQAYLWGLEGSSERGIEQLHSITRGGRIPESDPFQSLYSYFYACTLPEVRKGEFDDSLTVLNKALKLLQHRASKIEDSTRRWRYLNNNYWNHLLFVEARDKKMI